MGKRMIEAGTGVRGQWRKWCGKDPNAQYYFDYSLLATVILLVCFGLVMLYSISSYTAMIEGNGDMFYFRKQLIYTLLGCGLLVAFSIFPYQKYGKRIVWMMYIGCAFLMLLVQSPIGVSANGARRWIEIAGIQFQPSELAKLTVILFTSYQVCKVKDTIDNRENWITASLWLFRKPTKKRKRQMEILDQKKENWFTLLCYGGVLSVIILVFTDNLSTAIIVGGILLGLLAISSNMGVFCVIVAVGLVGGIVLVIWMIGPEFLTPIFGEFRVERILVWIHPENYAQDGGYQILQGLYAIGSGGWFGKGLGNGTQKLTAIPEVQNDYIIAAIIEELGIFGAGIVLLLFTLLLYRLYFIAKNAPDMYGGLIVSGIFIHIALQVIFNIGVVTAILPNTGVTLPFISYGGTAMWFLLIEIGLALQVSSNIKISD